MKNGKVFNWFANLGEKIEEIGNRKMPLWLAVLMIIAFAVLAITALAVEQLIALLIILVIFVVFSIPWRRIFKKK